ncbi:MAG TPA: UGSC family (seleno)protein [Streptosporangiaceae bacterium]|nr:UGSC family (seleno)protein [Streptosporangiaceae bacterium]
MAQAEKLLDPTGNDVRGGDTTLAPRLRSLTGLTLGLLGNTKPNAEVLLGEIARELSAAYALGGTLTYTKGYFGTPVEPGQLKEIAGSCDFVLTAIGDCGSCSAATTADGIMLERAGVPAVAICSDSFLLSARAMARAQGFPGFEFLTVPHPVASLDAEQIRQRARDVLPELLRILGVESS